MRALFKYEEDYYQPIKTKEVEAFKEGYCKFERNGDRCKTGSLPDYLRDTYLHLSSPINNFNDSKDGSKINLSLQIMFRNPQYITKELSMYLKIGNIMVFFGAQTAELISNIFTSSSAKYQDNLSEKIKSSGFMISYL